MKGLTRPAERSLYIQKPILADLIEIGCGFNNCMSCTCRSSPFAVRLSIRTTFALCIAHDGTNIICDWNKCLVVGC